MGETIRKYIQISGHVQGVGFRYRTKYAAEQLGITGWVSNMWSGDVEMEVQGQPAAIDEMLRLVMRGRYIRIDGIIDRQIPLENEERGFHIR